MDPKEEEGRKEDIVENVMGANVGGCIDDGGVKGGEVEDVT